MNDKVTVNNNNGGIGFFGLLTIVFVVLKILGYITWSWFWVFSPILFAIALVIFLVIISFIIALIFY